MVFPRPEAEDFRVIALAPYVPLGATFLFSGFMENAPLIREGLWLGLSGHNLLWM